MFPQISIGVACTTLLGKVVTLLWAIFLIIGPDYHAMRTFLDLVTFILSDYGTEKGIVDFPDVLLDFLAAIDVKVPTDAERLPFLFPHGIHSPGWEHSIDGLVRFYFCLFPWFPGFLRDLKNLARLMNRYGPNLADVLDAAGRRGAGTIIRKQTVSSFAHWRWGTIRDVARDCMTCHPILQNNLDALASYLNNIRDTVVAKGATRALTTPAWAQELEVVGWGSEHLVGLGRWGGSCLCHQDEFRAG